MLHVKASVSIFGVQVHADIKGLHLTTVQYPLSETVDIIQLLTTEVLDMTGYPTENTNIDRGDSQGQYWYSMVDINFLSNTSLVNNCFII